MATTKSNALRAVPLDHPVNTKISEEWVNATPAMAEAWLGQNHGNRNLRPQKVKQYARDMLNGKWLTSGDAIRFDWNGRLIDGQHRCEAIIESGATVRLLVIKGLDPHAREVIDTGAKRTGADALRFAGQEHNSALLAAVARIAIARDHGYLRNALASNPPTLTNSEVIDWVEGHPEVAHAAALAQRTFKPVQVQPSVWAYCLWELMMVDGPAAVEFATSTAEMRTNGKGDPAVRLTRRLPPRSSRIAPQAGPGRDHLHRLPRVERVGPGRAARATDPDAGRWSRF